jgi:hypothetical protein
MQGTLHLNQRVCGTVVYRGISQVWLLALGVLLGLIGLVSPVQADTILSIDSASTYLRINQDPDALTAMALDLGSLGFVNGDVIKLTRLGDFDCSFGLCGDSTVGMVGVFSASNLLDIGSTLHRVLGAIEAGQDFGPLDATLFGNLPMDIPEDFLIHDGGVLISIPVGAQYLFVGAYDNFFGDNVDPDHDFALAISYVNHPVPEPGTVLLFGSGLAGLVAWRRISHS